MGNTPCAHAVDSVLHQRVEIKAVLSRYTQNFIVALKFRLFEALKLQSTYPGVGVLSSPKE